MSAQDNTEKVLRSLHVLLSKSEPYSKEPSKVIVDKQKMLDLLSDLNKCMYDIMDEYELTQRSRDHAEREFRKHGDEIVWDASRKAEDIYAASVMYTDEALNSIQQIMKEATESVKSIYEEMDQKLKEREQMVRTNQSELKSQLQDLVDTEKYLKLIEERNREIAKEKAEKSIKEGKGALSRETSRYADRQTAIKINEEYFEKMGIPLEEEEAPSEEKEEGTGVEIKVDLDADYFRWKEEKEEDKKEEASGEKETHDISEGLHKVWKNFTSGKR